MATLFISVFKTTLEYRVSVLQIVHFLRNFIAKNITASWTFSSSFLSISGPALEIEILSTSGISIWGVFAR